MSKVTKREAIVTRADVIAASDPLTFYRGIVPDRAQNVELFYAPNGKEVRIVWELPVRPRTKLNRMASRSR